MVFASAHHFKVFFLEIHLVSTAFESNVFLKRRGRRQRQQPQQPQQQQQQQQQNKNKTEPNQTKPKPKPKPTNQPTKPTNPTDQQQQKTKANPHPRKNLSLLLIVCESFLVAGYVGAIGPNFDERQAIGWADQDESVTRALVLCKR